MRIGVEVGGEVMIDLSMLDWQTNLSRSLGTGGCYYKEIDRGYYYKISSYDSFLCKVTGIESINEVIVSRFCDIVGLPHICYNGYNALVKINDRLFKTYVCESKSFDVCGYSKVLYETLIEILKFPISDPVGNFKKLGFVKEYCEFCLLDFLIRNIDRHSANIEFLISNTVNPLADIKLVSPFDNGLSLYSFYCDNIYRMLSAPLVDNNVVNTCLTNDRTLITGLKHIKELGVKLVLNNLLTGSLDGNYLHMEKVCEILIGRYNYAKEKGIFTER